MIKAITKKGRKNLVVFVHGFLGGVDTWVNPSGVSFADMLLKNHKIKKHFDFAYAEYFSSIFNPVGSGAVMSSLKRKLNFVGIARRNLSISEIGELLTTALKHQCANYENVIIIAHSMGGLVTKACILSEIESLGQSRVKMFLSLAVPHKGSELANSMWAKLTTNPQAFDLKPLSSAVISLNDRWIKHHNLPRTVYFQAKYDTCVDLNSSIGYEQGEKEIVPCDEDHNTISKPEDNNRIVFKAVENLLLEFIDKTNIPRDLQLQEFVDSGEYDNSNFVLKMEMANIHEVMMNNAKMSYYNAEYIMKKIRPKKESKDNIVQMYLRIEDIYADEFGKHLSGEVDAGNSLLSNVQERIVNEDLEHLKVPFVDRIHKKGMLHQLADKLEKGIWWSRLDTLEQLDEYKTRKVVQHG